jgi:FlaA1/EpsC-like NDP-sugar epimerase
MTLPVLVRVVVDGLLINLAFFLTVVLAGHDSWPGSPRDYPRDAGLLTGCCLLVLSVCGLYSAGRAYRGRDKLLVVAQSVTLGYLLFYALAVLPRDPSDKGLIPALLLSWSLTVGLLVAARLRGHLWRYAARLDRHLRRNVGANRR